MTRSSENRVRECHQLQVPAERTFEVFTGRLPTHSWFAKETHHFIFFCKPTATIDWWRRRDERVFVINILLGGLWRTRSDHNKATRI